jgi:hypothetical protein
MSRQIVSPKTDQMTTDEGEKEMETSMSLSMKVVCASAQIQADTPRPPSPTILHSEILRIICVPIFKMSGSTANGSIISYGEITPLNLDDLDLGDLTNNA